MRHTSYHANHPTSCYSHLDAFGEKEAKSTKTTFFVREGIYIFIKCISCVYGLRTVLF